MRLRLTVGLLLAGCAGPDPGSLGDGAGDDGDEMDPPRFDVELGLPPSRAHFGAGGRLAPIVWATPGGLQEHGAFPRNQVNPATQPLRDLTEDWWDHELGIACAFTLHDSGRCLPRRLYLSAGPATNVTYADPACDDRVLVDELGDTARYARRVDSTGPLIAVSALGPVENGPVYQRFGDTCTSIGTSDYQRVEADVPLERFVQAQVEVAPDQAGRIVPVTMRTPDGAWRHVDAWDTELSTRVDPSDDLQEPWRWFPAGPSDGSTGQDWDNPPGWGADDIGRADVVWGSPSCADDPMLRISASAADWYFQTEASRRLPELARRGPNLGPVTAYTKTAQGICQLFAASCDTCYLRDERRAGSTFAVATRVLTHGERLSRYDWLDGEGNVLGLAEPARWYDEELDIDCIRSLAGNDGEFYCFPFPTTRPIFEDDRCQDKFGDLLDRRTSTPPPFVSSSAFLTTLLQVQWNELQPGERFWVNDCTAGCTCLPYEVQGPQAYYYTAIGGAIGPSQLVRFDRRILDPG